MTGVTQLWQVVHLWNIFRIQQIWTNPADKLNQVIIIHELLVTTYKYYPIMLILCNMITQLLMTSLPLESVEQCWISLFLRQTLNDIIESEATHNRELQPLIDYNTTVLGCADICWYL